MIVPMKRIFLVLQAKDKFPALESLQKLGVVHVEHVQTPEGYHLTEISKDIQDLERTITILANHANDDKLQHSPDHWKSVVSKVVEYDDESQELTEELVNLNAQIRAWEPWGEFEPNDAADLRRKGIFLHFCEISKKEFEQFKAQGNVYWSSSSGATVHAVIITRGDEKFQLKESDLPLRGLSEMKSRVRTIQEQMEGNKGKLKQLSVYRQHLQDAAAMKRKEFEFGQVESGLGADGELVYLKGFCPAESCADLTRSAQQHSWGLLAADISDEDRPPTFIRNPKWIDIIKPVFGVINVLPGYKEVDISLVFLIFFSIFFGILIGDAAYGLIFLGLTAFFQFKLKNKVTDQSPFFLMYVLSAAAITWGVLTGTFLGTVLLGKMVKPVITWLTESKNVQLFCFILGAVHLTIAHIWRFLNKIPSISASAELGSICIIWGGLFVANMMIIGIPLMWFVKYLFIIGAVLIMIDIFTQPKDTIFVNIILFVFGVINAFTDVVSYVRLFAVGLAGVAVADAFNEMALSIGFGNVAAGIITSLILIVGHLFNIVLCGFGILVHGLRLNVLEFSGHLGLEWAGIKYTPFKLDKKS